MHVCKGLPTPKSDGLQSDETEDNWSFIVPTKTNGQTFFDVCPLLVQN